MLHVRLRSRSFALTLPLFALTLGAVTSTGCVTLSPLEEARAHAYADEYDQAERWYEAAISEPEYREEAIEELVAMDLERANAALSTDPEEASRRYKKVLRYRPDNEQAIMGLGRLYMRQENWAEAVDVLAEARADGCSTCKTLLASIYFHAGEHEVEDGDYHLADEHFENSIRLLDDPQVMIAKATIYTHGNHGGWEPAVNSLSRAGRRLKNASPGAYETWLVTRRELFSRAALNGEVEAIDAALAVPDPRPLDDQTRAWEIEVAEVEAASMLIEHGRVDEGAARAIDAYQRAMNSGTDAQKDEMRAMVVTQLRRQAAFHMRAGEVKLAINGLEKARQVDPDDDTLTFQQAICYFSRNYRHGEAILKELPRSTEGLDRVRAVGWIAYGMTKFDEEEYGSAKKAWDKAAKSDATLPEVYLLSALFHTQGRLEGLSKWEFEAWREVGSFKYPGNRVVRSASAKAQLQLLEGVYDEAARDDVVRAPDFHNRYEELTAALAYYPYAVKWTGDGRARLELFTESDAKVDAKLVPGKRMVETFEVTTAAKGEYDLAEPEYVVVEAGGQKRTVFVEPDVTISIQI